MEPDGLDSQTEMALLLLVYVLTMTASYREKEFIKGFKGGKCQGQACAVKGLSWQRCMSGPALLCIRGRT